MTKTFMTIVSRALFLETESSQHTAFFFARPRALAKAKQTDQNIILFALISRCPSARSPFYSRTSVDHPRRYVPPHRQSSRFPTTPARAAAPARDSRRRAAPGAFAVRDAALGTLTHPTPSRDAMDAGRRDSSDAGLWDARERLGGYAA